MQTFYTKETDEFYFGLPYISQSSLKYLTDLNPAQHAALMLERSQMATSDAMRMGTILHNLNLESMPVESLAQFKRLDGRTAEGKAQKQAIAGLKSWAYEDEIQIMLKMQDLFKASFQAQELMSKAKYIEHYAVAEIHNNIVPENKIFMKFKPDIVGDTFLADYKTINDYATDENIRRSLKSGDYPFQAACYLVLDSLITGTRKNHFAFIFQEAIPPYGVRVIRLQDRLIDMAMDRFYQAINKHIMITNHPEKASNPNYEDVDDIGLIYY